MSGLTYNLERTDDIPGGIEKACIAWGHEIGHSAHFGYWHQNAPILNGFDSALDAWCFIVATTGIDPSAGTPDGLKRWTKRQPDESAEKKPAPYAQFSLLGEQNV